MEISKNAWHYKILMDGTKSKIRNGTSLCRYFWSVVHAIFAWCLIGVLGVVAIGCVGMLIYWFFYVWYFILAEAFFGVGAFNIPDIEISFFLNTILVLGMLVSMGIRWKKKRKFDQKPPNLVVEYVKAKKRKICPIVTVRD